MDIIQISLVHPLALFAPIASTACHWTSLEEIWQQLDIMIAQGDIIAPLGQALIGESARQGHIAMKPDCIKLVNAKIVILENIVMVFC